MTIETLTRRKDGAPEGLCALEENLFIEQSVPVSLDSRSVRLLQADSPYQEVEQAAEKSPAGPRGGAALPGYCGGRPDDGDIRVKSWSRCLPLWHSAVLRPAGEHFG